MAGSSNVLVNSRPAIRVGDPGIHAACCGPNKWNAKTGSASVLINSRPAHRLGDLARHCGGMGSTVEGSGNVIVGGLASSSGMPMSPPSEPKSETEEEEEKKITIVIKAENGIDDPPTAIAVSMDKTTNKVKLKGVPSEGSGTYEWRTTSPHITLENSTSQIVTVVAKKKASSSPASENIELVFTPTGKAPLAPVTHSMGVGTVLFSKEPSHPWGYDAYEKIPSIDKNKKSITPAPQPKPEYDFISIKKSDTGKVSVLISGVKPEEIFFLAKDASICSPKVMQATSSNFILEIEAKAKNKNETVLEAHIGSATGPVVATLGVVVLKEITYKAELFRVKDTKSATTALSLAPTSAGASSALNEYYKQGVAIWKFTGGASETDVSYDLNKNGALDMEPGTTGAEQKKIIAACVSSVNRVIYVQNLRWAYYLATDTEKTDTWITIKNYGASYLGFISTGSHTISDDKGSTISVNVKSVNTATGQVELSAAINSELKVANKAALLFPLGGLSGDPLWVGNKATLDILYNYMAHELGHSVADLRDVCELDNLMHGGSNTGAKLRRRPIAKYYDLSSNEEQWLVMKNR